MPLTSKRRADFAVVNGGTIYLLHPLTQEAKDWADKYIDANHQKFGNAIAVEHRYIQDIIVGIINDGLAVR